METYEEIVMQAVSQLMEKAISEQLAADEKVIALTDELADIGGARRVPRTALIPLSSRRRLRVRRIDKN